MSRLAGPAPLVILALMLPPAAADTPDAAKQVAPPGGYKLLLEVKAKGVQVYRAVEGEDKGRLSWKHEGPLADLFDGEGRRAGYHYDGPAWEALDGSKVVADGSGQVKKADAPKPKADLPWLLVPVKGGQKGTLKAAAYVQRAETAGGLAPKDAPKRAGTRVGVPYTAVYRFYGKAE
jgi:hypothetical protein